MMVNQGYGLEPTYIDLINVTSKMTDISNQDDKASHILIKSIRLRQFILFFLIMFHNFIYRI